MTQMDAADPKDDLPWTRVEPDSPCVQICVMHPSERLCVGCFRSLEEIGAWGSMTPEARREVMSELPARAERVENFKPKRRGRRTKLEQ